MPARKTPTPKDLVLIARPDDDFGYDRRLDATVGTLHIVGVKGEVDAQDGDVEVSVPESALAKFGR